MMVLLWLGNCIMKSRTVPHGYLEGKEEKRNGRNEKEKNVKE